MNYKNNKPMQFNNNDYQPIPKKPSQQSAFPQSRHSSFNPNSYQRNYPIRRRRYLYRRRRSGFCCCISIPVAVSLLVISLAYFFLPLRTNILLLGVDYADFESYVARSDTIIMTTIVPLKPYVGMLSIPRDLWVTIPGFGENRINTAHFYAEAQQPGSGPDKVIETIEQNFGIRPDYYARIRFDGFREIVDALDGIVIDLPRPMAGYPAGKHYLTGNKALAFVRNREWSDDFSRMEQAQFMLGTLMSNLLKPDNWRKIPAVYQAIRNAIDTDVPFWLWPRLGLAVLRAGPNGIDNQVIDRQMVTPFITSGGAYVLAPNWQMINPIIVDMFSK